MGDVQYTGRYHEHNGDIISTLGVFSTLGDIMSTVEDIMSTLGVCSVHREDIMINVGEVIGKTIEFVWKPQSRGVLECNLTGRCPFLKSLHNPFGKKIAF